MKEVHMKTILRTAILAALLLSSAAIYSQAATDDPPQPPCEALATNTAAMPGMMMQGMDAMPCGRPGMMAGPPSPAPCMADESMRPRHHHGMNHGHGMEQVECEMMDRGHGRHQMDDGMMGPGRGMQQMDCGMMGMGQGKMGRHGGGMQHRMGRMLFLDRAEALELTEDQVAKLKTIHADCRRENIRQEAEARIARLELKDLLDESNWIPAAAEKLIRKIKTLEGDLQVRHLRAVAEARKVLTPEQLRRADSDRDDDDAESLFK
jgi:Spy/CpxP family protein refolding chaperone